MTAVPRDMPDTMPVGDTVTTVGSDVCHVVCGVTFKNLPPVTLAVARRYDW